MYKFKDRFLLGALSGMVGGIVPLSFLDHMIGGATIGLLSARLGDDSLFPDYKVESGEDKLPLAYVNRPHDYPSPESRQLCKRGD